MKDFLPPYFNRPRICRKLHFCPACGKAYRRKIELDMHLLCHSLPPKSPENLWRFHLADRLARCPRCLKGFCRRRDLMCHMDNVGGCVKNGTASSVAAVDYKTPSVCQTVAMKATNCHGSLYWENRKQGGYQGKLLRRPDEAVKLKLSKCTTKFERQCAIVQRFLDAEKQTTDKDQTKTRHRSSKRYPTESQETEENNRRPTEYQKNQENEQWNERTSQLTW